jgi:hypothetical protein
MTYKDFFICVNHGWFALRQPHFQITGTRTAVARLRRSGYPFGRLVSRAIGLEQESLMKKSVTASLMLTVALGLGACSDKAQNETSEAANAIVSDAQATADNAAADVANISADAVGAAENAADKAGDALENGAAKVKAGAADTLDDASRDLRGS